MALSSCSRLEGLGRWSRCVDLERADGMFALGLDKGDQRRVVQHLDDLEAIQPGHLDVEQYRVGQQDLDYLYGLGAILGGIRGAMARGAGTAS